MKKLLSGIKRSRKFNLLGCLKRQVSLYKTKKKLNKFSISSSRFFKNAIDYYIGVIINALLNILVIYVLSTSLEKNEFAVFSLYTNLFLLLSSFNTSWVIQGIYRFSSIFNDSDRNILRKSNAQISLLQGSIVAIIGASIILIFFRVHLSFLIFLVLLPINNFYLVNIAHLQTEKKIRTYWLFEISRISIFILTASVVIFTFFNNKLPLIYLSLTLSYLIPSIFLFIREYKTSFREFSKFIFFHTRSIFNYGWPLALWFIFAQLQNVGDRYVLAYFLDLKYVGIYAIVYDLVYKSVIMFTSPLLSYLQPIIMEYHNNNDIERREKILNNLIKIFLLLFLVGGIFLFFFSNMIFHFFGKIDDYDCSIITVLIFSGSCIWQIAMIVHKPLEFNKQTSKMLFAIIVSFSINIGLNILLIPIYNSLIVPATITLVSSIIYCVYVYISALKSEPNQKETIVRL